MAKSDDYPEEINTEITAVGYEPPRPPAKTMGVAEAFQEMLWQAFKAGCLSNYDKVDTIRQSFEAWYQREVCS